MQLAAYMWLVLITLAPADLASVLTFGISPLRIIVSLKMNWPSKILALVVLCVTLFVAQADDKTSREKQIDHYNVVLLGATGDLAKRYLWKAFFDLYKKEVGKSRGKTQFSIYACGRSDPDEGRFQLSEVLLGVIKCFDDDCRNTKKKLVEATQYVQTKNESHFQVLGDRIAENTQSMYGLQGEHVTYEKGRLIYLSIPPSAYGLTAKAVQKYLRPRLGHPWVRVVLEKPFGHDTNSAKNLAKKLSKYFKEEEIYRTDHYLGKSISRLILPFRYKHIEQYGSMWNHNFIERIEVVMKETIDVQGRWIFYEDVGVIRDVMQNHLMELMMLVAMELPINSGNIQDILQAKLKVLKEIKTPGPENTITGQYDGYAADVRENMNKTGRISTPTFAASVFYVNNAQWQGVPFVLLSGKKLDTKASYVRVVFKNAMYCVGHEEECEVPKQIIFHVASGDLLRPPMILISKALPKPAEFPSWRFENIGTNMTFFGQPVSDMHQLMAENEVDAYVSIVRAVYNAERHMFSNKENLMASWNIWTPILKRSRNGLCLYQGGPEGNHELDFVIQNYNLKFVRCKPAENVASLSEETRSQIPETFLGAPLVAGHQKELIAKLAEDIYEKAKEAVTERGQFHLVLSGGDSPRPLMLHLATEYLMFPWKQTHIWLVDERCVPMTDDESNFKSLESNLLELINIPYLNIHPMPVHINKDPCQVNDEGDILYQSIIKRLVPESRFDYVILGLGSDGHTASLFPWQQSLRISKPLVIYSSTLPEKEGDPIDRRMTLTFSVINNSRHISVLVTGKKKHSILNSLRNNKNSDFNEYPILAVEPKDGILRWYIDYRALTEPKSS